MAFWLLTSRTKRFHMTIHQRILDHMDALLLRFQVQRTRSNRNMSETIRHRPKTAQNRNHQV